MANPDRCMKVDSERRGQVAQGEQRSFEVALLRDRGEWKRADQDERRQARRSEREAPRRWRGSVFRRRHGIGPEATDLATVACLCRMCWALRRRSLKASKRLRTGVKAFSVEAERRN